MASVGLGYRPRCLLAIISWASVPAFLAGLIKHFDSGFTINRICWAAGLGLAKALPGVAVTARNWMVTGLGLGVIPLIIHPIDK